MTWQTKKLLITGIPGMGKTTIGDYLSEKYNFVHIDMESENQQLINQRHNIDNNIVVTWGFVPVEEQISYVETLGNEGFKLIWLDGDRETAFREFTKRDSQLGEQYLQAQLSAFNTQLDRIEKSNVVARIKPKIYNTFDQEHKFKKLETIIQGIQND